MITGSRFQLAEKCQHWETLHCPDTAGAAAAEGTRKHAAIHQLLSAGHDDDPPEPEPWLRTVWNHWIKARPKGDVYTEIAFGLSEGSARVLNSDGQRDYSDLRPGEYAMTADVVVVGPDLVHVWDWKTGKTKLGPAEDSLQLGSAALAACRAFERERAEVAYKYVTDARVTTDGAALSKALLSNVARRLSVIRGLGTEPHPGSHCEELWCPARGVCRAWLVSGAPQKIREKESRPMGKMSIQSVQKGKESPLCLIVYGRGGVGKTSFAKGAPSPVFLAEKDGLVQHPDADRFPDAESWADIIEAVDTLATTKHQWKTLVIDTLDWVEQFARAKVVEEHGKFDEDFGRGYKHELPYWIELQKKLDKLRNAGMHVVLLSHATVKQRRDPTTDPFDCWIPTLPPAILDMWRNWSSALLYAAYEMNVVVEGKGASKRVRGISDGSRVLYTDERAGFVAKNRYGLPFELPLEWGDFEAAVRAGSVEDPTVIRAAIESVAAAASEKLASVIRGHLERVGDDAGKLAKLLNWSQVQANKESEVAA